MESTARSADETAYVCRSCVKPIASGTGVVAAPRLATRALRPGPPLPVFGAVAHFHALCVPASYRIDDRF